MMRSISLVVVAAAVYQTRASFVQCSPSESLEPFDALDGSEHAHAQLVNCDRWPYYSGGHPHSNGYSQSSSSSSDDSSDEKDSLLPSFITADTLYKGFNDGVETTQCVESTQGVCSKWTVTMQEYEDTHGCGHSYRSEEAKVLTSYKLCACATFTASYCQEWACLDMNAYPTEAQIDSMSLIKDNQFVSIDASNLLIGDNIWRFKTDDGMVELADNMELKNCWCQTENMLAEACDDWFCGTVEHQAWNDDFGEFAVDGFGRFGCFDSGENATACANWYGFMYHGNDFKFHDRDEYRCQCVDDDCLSSVCALKQIPVRKNWVWYNFPLALVIWVCCFGCCGTKIVFRSKYMKCRKCRMFLFFCLIGTLAIYHGGLPAFVCFAAVFGCSLCGAVKREKCGGRRGCCGKRWAARMKANCEAKKLEKQMETPQYVKVVSQDETALNGENSKDESVEDVNAVNV